MVMELLGTRLDLIILEVFYNLSDSMVLRAEAEAAAVGLPFTRAEDKTREKQEGSGG